MSIDPTHEQTALEIVMVNMEGCADITIANVRGAIERALKAAEERGAGRASQEWLDKASSAQAAKVADVIKEFPKPADVVISDPWPHAADNSKRSYDVAVEAMRGKLVESVKALRAEAVERIGAAIIAGDPGFEGTDVNPSDLADSSTAALDETLAWLSEAELPPEITAHVHLHVAVKALRREFKAIEGE